MNPLTVQDAARFAGAVIIVNLLMRVLLGALGLPFTVQFAPAIAVLVGIAVVEIATWANSASSTKADVVQAAITGILAGTAAMGLQQSLVVSGLTQ